MTKTTSQTARLEALSNTAASAIARDNAETAWAALDGMRAILMASPRTPRARDWAAIITDRTGEVAAIRH